MQKIVTNLWFDGRVEEALELYTSCFDEAHVRRITRYAEAGVGETGDIMTAEFELAGQEFCIINGGPHFSHSPAMSLAVNCVDQDEVDTLWGNAWPPTVARRKSMWLAHRSIRRLLADRADSSGRDAGERRCGGGGTRHQGVHGDEQAGHRRVGEGVSQ